MADLEKLADLLKRHRECGPLAALDLNRESLAVVAGAYEGATVQFISELYGCHVLGFEPQEWAAHRARERLHHEARYTRASILNYAVGAESGELPMGEVGTDAASFISDPAARTHGTGRIREWGAVMENLAVRRVALLLLNVEGYEYVLLPHLDKLGWLSKISHIIIQFHDMERSPYDETVKLLARTHRLTWEHSNWSHWTWQSWEPRR